MSRCKYQLVLVSFFYVNDKASTVLVQNQLGFLLLTKCNMKPLFMLFIYNSVYIYTDCYYVLSTKYTQKLLHIKIFNGKTTQQNYNILAIFSKTSVASTDTFTLNKINEKKNTLPTTQMNVSSTF